MPNPFFDGIKFPWTRDEARALHKALYSTPSLQTRKVIVRLLVSAGQDVDPVEEAGPRAMWGEALDNLATARRVEEFCNLLLQDKTYVAIHDAVRAVQSARDATEHIVLSDDRLFINRQQLRDKLQRLMKSKTRRVLLVRGGAKCGKSWTQYMIADLADSRGEMCIYLNEDNVKSRNGLFEHLFLTIGGAQAKWPEQTESEIAWYQRICTSLIPYAEKKGPWWIVVDDLGVGDTGPRFETAIKEFFDQFALAMKNPAFAKWFRLVLIDYPEGRLPTRWSDFWEEDRPDAAHLDTVAISRFVIDWAQRQNKQLGPEGAELFAQQVMAAVETVADPEKSRLQSVHDAIVQALAKL
jgi:hypothetical protein